MLPKHMSPQARRRLNRTMGDSELDALAQEIQEALMYDMKYYRIETNWFPRLSLIKEVLKRVDD